MESESCSGCGLELPPFDGPTHAYLGASAECWALYGEVLAREFSDLRYARLHGTTVDAYAVQHPGLPDRRTIRSAALHLMRLMLVVERGDAQDRATKIMARLARSNLEFAWLDPPEPNGAITVRDVLAANDPEKHLDVVEAWAHDLWSAWSEHHDRIERWLEEGLG